MNTNQPETDSTRVSRDYAIGPRAVEIFAQMLEAAPLSAGLAPGVERACFLVFTTWVCKINYTLGRIRRSGFVNFDPERRSWQDADIQDFRPVLPMIRRIYESRKDQWFTREIVLKHGYCYARTWADIVIHTAEEFSFLAHQIDSIRACEFLRESEYNSSEVHVHLEIETSAAQASGVGGTHEVGNPRNKRNTRNNSEKHSLLDDDNTLCLAAARDTGSTFTSAAAFVRDYLEKRPKCKATKKALEMMLSRECDIWKK